MYSYVRMLHVQSRQFLQLYYKVLYQMPAAHYARGRKPTRGDPVKVHDMQPDFDDPMMYQLTDMFEEMESLDQKPSSDAAAERKRVAFKTIERKFFRPPQEVNLLTWDAKEQIRFLHQEFPEEWTEEKLAQSFPVSVDGVRRLLRSRFQPRSVQDVVKHDRRVQRAWKALKNVKRGKLAGGPIVSRYESLLEDNQIHLLSNAAGCEHLPCLDWQQKWLTDQKDKRRQPGLYESIVTDYLKLKMVTDEVVSSLSKEQQQQLLADNSLSNKVFLQILMKNVGKTDKEQTTGMTKVTTVSNRSIKLDDSREGIKNDSDTFPHRIRHDMDLHKKMAKHDQVLSSPSKHFSLDEPSDLGLKDTQKLSRYLQKDDDTQNVSEMSKEEIENLQKENIDCVSQKERRPTEELPDTIFFESPEGSDIAEPYIYHPDKGYRYPFGRVSDLPKDKIDISKINKSPNESVLVQDGKDVYDEDGEFLYRIP